jgi:large subunit ribosomal protein L7/L12
MSSNINIKELAEKLVNMSVKDVNELGKILKEDYGIEPAAAAPVMVSAASDTSKDSETPEKSKFNVIMKSAGASKLNVVKLLKDTLGLSLKDAKDLADSAPKAIKEDLPKKEAEDLKAIFVAAGAEIDIV